MNKRRSFLIMSVIALLVVLGLGGLGMTRSTSAAALGYTLDWSVVGGSGSASTQLDSTVGQTAIGWSTGTNQLGSGFWYGTEGGYEVYLPVVLRNL